MTPKEKAEELFFKFYTYQSMRINLYGTSEQRAKECALIAVDEMLIHTMNCDYGCAGYPYNFWEQVKNEIERL